MGPAWPCRKPIKIEFCKNFENVWEVTSGCKAVAVDIPIGLPDGPATRACDHAARLALGNRRSSVFLAPPRSCLDTPSPTEFQDMHNELRDIGAGYPVWGIVPKMLEVNLIMEARVAYSPIQDRIIEFHPELTWQRLAHPANLSSKKGAEGILQRLILLEALSPGWLPKVPLKIRGNPAIDGVLDAVVGISATQSFFRKKVQRYPVGEPDQNSAGLRMEIWY